MADLDLVRDVATHADHFAVLATTRRDGSVHASVVKAGVLVDPATGSAVVGAVVGGSSRKLAHLRAGADAAFVFSKGPAWVAVDGPVRLHGPDDPPGTDAAALLREVFVAAGGTHEDWAAFDRSMLEDRRCAVLVTPRRISANG